METTSRLVCRKCGKSIRASDVSCRDCGATNNPLLAITDTRGIRWTLAILGGISLLSLGNSVPLAALGILFSTAVLFVISLNNSTHFLQQNRSKVLCAFAILGIGIIGGLARNNGLLKTEWTPDTPARQQYMAEKAAALAAYQARMYYGQRRKEVAAEPGVVRVPVTLPQEYEATPKPVYWGIYRNSDDASKISSDSSKHPAH